jgi:hypothetical protein
MLDERLDKTIWHRFGGPFIGICAISVVAVFLCMAYLSRGGDRRIALLAAAISLTAGIVAAATLSFYVLGRYTCPQCRKRLPRIKDSNTGEYRFQCDACGIVWNTGLKKETSPT